MRKVKHIVVSFECIKLNFIYSMRKAKLCVKFNSKTFFLTPGRKFPIPARRKNGNVSFSASV